MSTDTRVRGVPRAAARLGAAARAGAGARLDTARRGRALLTGQPWWLRVAWALLAVQVLVRAALTWPAFFNMDDFFYLTDAQQQPFWEYTTQYYNGHLMPLGFAVTWLAQRAWPMQWAPFFWILMALNLWCSVLWIRLARALFPPSPWLVIPTAILFFSPLWWGTSIWFASGIQIIPMTIATLGVLLHATRHHAGAGTRALVAASAYLVFGLLMWEKSLLLWIPLLGVFAGFLRPGRWGWTALRSTPLLWLLAGISAAYATLYMAGLPAVPLDDQPSAADLVEVVRTAIGGVLIPGLFGGPWSAPSGGPVGYGQPPPGWVQWICLQVAVLVVAASVARWRPAWRAWAILAAYLTATLGLFALARLDGFGLALAADPRYVEDALPVAVLALALAFIRPHHSPLPEPPPLQQRRAVPVIATAGLVAANLYAATTVAIGTMWRDSAAQSFVTTLRAEVDRLGPVAVADRKAPPDVMAPLFLERANLSYIMAPADLPVVWDGPGDTLYQVADDGTLRPGTLAEAASSQPAGDCPYPAESGEVAVETVPALYDYVWVVKVTYEARQRALGELTLGRGRPAALPIRPGTRDLWLATNGDPGVVTIRLPEGTDACIRAVAVGTLQ